MSDSDDSILPTASTMSNNSSHNIDNTNNNNNNNSGSINVPYNSSESFMQIFCRQMLKTRIFHGNYIEKRYVDCLHGYRDLIQLNVNVKTTTTTTTTKITTADRQQIEFIEDLVVVRNRIMRFYKNNIWVGFTNETNQIIPTTATAADASLQNTPCIWANFKVNIPFGQYWFQVKSIQFKANEVYLKLAVLKEYTAPNGSGIGGIGNVVGNQTVHTQQQQQQQQKQTNRPETTQPNQSNPNNNNDNDNNPNINQQQIPADFIEYFQIFKRDMHDSLLRIFSTHVTASNTLYSLQYLVVFIATLFATLCFSIKYLGFFVLGLLERTNQLIHVLTPILLRLIDLLNKIIGGLFILLAMIWRDCIGGGGNGSGGGRTGDGSFVGHIDDRQRRQQQSIQWRPIQQQPLHRRNQL